MEHTPVVVEALFEAPIGKVWQAITDGTQMRQWFFGQMPDFEPRVGFRTQFDVVANGKVYPHIWTVSEVLPQERIVYNWKYGGYEGDSFVSWQLLPTNNQTRLVLTHSGIESFPKDNNDFSYESCKNGWKFLLQQRLKGYLENGFVS